VRRALVAWLIVAMVSLTIGFRPANAQIIFDNRVDWTARPNGTIGVLGDSVGYGLVVIGGITNTMAAANWGPVRSYTLAGLHAAPEGSGDPHNVATWINTFRSQGILPRVMLIVSGSNDVGWPQGDSVVRNQQRIETAMAALGTTEVVWSTITHHNPAYETAWNQALINAAAKWPNLHLCDWRGLARSTAGMLASDQVHATGNGYRAMRDLMMSCVAGFGTQARFLGAPAFPALSGGTAGRLQPQTPQRVVDTRTTGNPLGQGEVRVVNVAAPGTNTTAAALNLTTVDAAGSGYLTAYPCNQGRPLASNLNYTGAAPVAAGVTVGVDSGGNVCIFSLRPTHLVVDVQATYRTPAGGLLGFTNLAPTRLADTRSGGRIGPSAPLEVNVGGPAAWLNITAVDAVGSGFLAAYPCGGTVPLVSNVNYLGGPQAVANAATVTANGTGKVCVYANVPTHIVVDQAGRFGATGASFVPSPPFRVLDSRVGTGGWQGSAELLQSLTVDLSAAVPPAATGVVGTATAITDRPAFVTAYPAGQPVPTASNINPPGWTPTANAVSIPGRHVALVSNGHGYHLFDVTGWWQ
jgi:hypothetical protein